MISLSIFTFKSFVCHQFIWCTNCCTSSNTLQRDITAHNTARSASQHFSLQMQYPHFRSQIPLTSHPIKNRPSITEKITSIGKSNNGKKHLNLHVLVQGWFPIPSSFSWHQSTDEPDDWWAGNCNPTNRVEDINKHSHFSLLLNRKLHSHQEIWL